MLADMNGALLMIFRRLAKARFLGLAGRWPILMLSAIAAMVAWSSNASAAQGDGCGAPGTGDCFEPGLTPYCDDLCAGRPCEGCCEFVCAGDPFCCDEGIGSWDGFCSTTAEVLCDCFPDEDPPANDECTSALPVTLGDTAISNLCATIGGPEHANPACNDGPGGLAGMGYDVWFAYHSSFTGTLAVSTCDQLDESWDSQLAVYEGCNCSNLSDPPLACNHDFIGCQNGTSRLVIDTLPNTCYLIRVGSSFAGAFGTGTLSLLGQLCTDFNGDDRVDAADLAVILLGWGPCPGCVADVDGDGQVDASDLAALLASWGPCSQ